MLVLRPQERRTPITTQRQAEQYWPPLGKEMELDELSITCEAAKEVNEALTKSVFKIKGKEGVKEIMHIHVFIFAFSGLVGPI